MEQQAGNLGAFKGEITHGRAVHLSPPSEWGGLSTGPGLFRAVARYNKRMKLLPGLSFSFSRAVGLAAAKGRISRAIGIPLTRGGRQRKVGSFILNGLAKLLGR